jgi:predicted DCC family thiol-disulfide oxidoreductase YuxK
MATDNSSLAKPVKPVVIYDGECPFCIRQIERFKSLDPNNQFDYVPRQQPGVEDRFPILAHSDFDTGMRYIDINGKVEVGADAVYQIARRLPLFRPVAWIYRLPVCKQIVRLVYAWVAANRKRLGQTCENGACNITHPGGH